MVMTLEGIYRDGKVELADTPAGIGEARVLVVFVPEKLPISGETREAVLARVVDRMNKGLDLGGPPYPKREELHDRGTK